ncbi:hypothetical protein I7I48_02537 [Histoplasma ohiense]|nr:hypothetical protein I7I48_02537 [Histoplasma ohiense (nom. inval.)]
MQGQLHERNRPENDDGCLREWGTSRITIPASYGCYGRLWIMRWFGSGSWVCHCQISRMPFFFFFFFFHVLGVPNAFKISEKFCSRAPLRNTKLFVPPHHLISYWLF